jgi:hypothetical protein
MKKLFLLLFCFITYVSKAQGKSEIDFMNFKYHASTEAFSSVEISIIKNLNWKGTTFELEANYYESLKKKKKKIKISEEEFNSIVNSFYTIKSSDLIDIFSFGLDGSVTELKIGVLLSNSIKFELWGIHKGKINTNLKELIETIQLILKIADLKIENFN